MSETTINQAASGVVQLTPEAFLNLAHVLPAAIYTTDCDGRITMFNEAAAEMWGRRPEIGVDLWCGSWKIFTPAGEHVPLDACPMAIALKERRKMFGHEIVVERPDGTRAIVTPFPQPLYDNNGKMVGAVNLLVDVTERRIRELELHETQERLSATFRQAAVGMSLLDSEGRFLEVNQKFCDILCYSAVEMQLLSCKAITYPPDWPVSEHYINRLIEGELTEFTTEKRYVRKDGEVVWVNLAMSVVHGPSGEPLKLAAVIEDITPRRKAEAELQELNRSLESKVVSRTSELEALCYSIAHDLRQHIRGVSINSHLLGDELQGATPEVSVLLERLTSAAKHMDSLVTDLLSYANRSRQELRRADVDVTKLAEDAAATLDPIYCAEVRIQPGMTAIADRALTSVIILNLLDNACKYGPAGKKTLIEVGEQDGVFYVRDNGVGFDMTYAKQLFEPFKRLHRHADIPGTGLGLASVAQIVERHGGEVWAEGTPGQGSTFYFTLPM